MFWAMIRSLCILFNIFARLSLLKWSEVKRGDASTESDSCALGEMDSRSFRRLSSVLADANTSRIYRRHLLMNLRVNKW